MMTKAQKRALEATERGLVTRQYHKTGNTIKGPPGVSSTMLWRVLGLGWIVDGRGQGITPGVFVKTVRMELTSNGANALKKEQAHAR